MSCSSTPRSNRRALLCVLAAAVGALLIWNDHHAGCANHRTENILAAPGQASRNWICKDRGGGGRGPALPRREPPAMTLIPVTLVKVVAQKHRHHSSPFSLARNSSNKSNFHGKCSLRPRWAFFLCSLGLWLPLGLSLSGGARHAAFTMRLLGAVEGEMESSAARALQDSK